MSEMESPAYRIIDENAWDRAGHCAVFRNYVEPCFCVTYQVDVTSFLRSVRERGVSFTMAMVYAVCSAANAIEAFRYRFLDGKVVLYDRIDAAFTYLDAATDLFKVVRVPLEGDIWSFADHASAAARAQKEYFTGPLGNDVFQCSSLPWVEYTHISHTISGKKDNATPLFDWGKHHEEGERVMMPFSVQAHHSFVDGLHVGLFAKSLQDLLCVMGT